MKIRGGGSETGYNGYKIKIALYLIDSMYKYMNLKKLQAGYFAVTCNHFKKLQIENITYCFIRM